MRATLFVIFFFWGTQIGFTQGVCFNCGATYYHTDASVPPKYHRSYTISVQNDSVQFAVYSYGDTLLKETYKTPDFKNFLMNLKGCKLGKRPFVSRKECTGGTSDSFFSSAKINQGKQWVQLKINGTVEHCGGKDYGNLKGDTEKARVLFISMVPNFEVKLASTRK